MTYLGTVKWFDAAKGFGFVICDKIAGDVMLHAQALHKNGFANARPGDEIAFALHEEKQRRVGEVYSLTPRDVVHSVEERCARAIEALAEAAPDAAEARGMRRAAEVCRALSRKR